MWQRSHLILLLFNSQILQPILFNIILHVLVYVAQQKVEGEDHRVNVKTLVQLVTAVYVDLLQTILQLLLQYIQNSLYFGGSIPQLILTLLSLFTNLIVIILYAYNRITHIRIHHIEVVGLPNLALFVRLLPLSFGKTIIGIL